FERRPRLAMNPDPVVAARGDPREHPVDNLTRAQPATAQTRAERRQVQAVLGVQHRRWPTLASGSGPGKPGRRERCCSSGARREVPRADVAPSRRVASASDSGVRIPPLKRGSVRLALQSPYTKSGPGPDGAENGFAPG